MVPRSSARVLKDFQAMAAAQRLARLAHWQVADGRFAWSTDPFAVFLGGAAPGGAAPELLELVHVEDRPRVAERLLAAEAHELEFRMVFPDGRELLVHQQAEPIEDGRGGTVLFGVTQDMAAARLARQRAAQLALHDDLTGLPNQAFLQRWLRRAVAGAKRQRREVAVLALESGLVRGARDAGGPAFADAAVRALARRLCRTIGVDDQGADGPETTLVARTGEDGWAVVLDGVGPVGAVGMARELRAALSTGLAFGARELFAAPAVGVSVAPRDGDDPRVLLARAELALRRARACLEGVVVFDETMADAARRTAELENLLRGEVARLGAGEPTDELRLVCQPRVNVRLDAVVAVEARVVWQPPGRLAVAPEEVAELAAATGLAARIDAWAVRAACLQGRRWADERRPVRIVLVVSTAAALEPLFIERVAAALDETGLPRGLLALQLRERELAAHGERGALLLADLGRLGVQLELEGAALPGRFRAHAVKLDRAHLEQLADAPSREITRAAIAAATAAGQRVVLDGVETASQVRFCLSQRVHEAQGAFLGGPVRAEEISVEALEETSSRAHFTPFTCR